jgi:hypothetical protein
MKNSKFKSFLNSENLVISDETARNLRGGAKNETWEQCIEQTGDAESPDATVEKWPDGGGTVSSLTYRYL